MGDIAAQTGWSPFLGNRATATQGMPSTPATGTGGTNTDGGGFDSLLGSTLGTAANIWGNQNAAEAASHGNQAGITTQQNTMGNINSIYGSQSNLGNGAFDTLGSTLGINGQPADYSNFLNMPGYQFAVQQGTQAIQRQATTGTNGGPYSPNTMIDIGKYVTGTAMQDYNTYVQQLMGAGNFGQDANRGRAGAYLQTGGNISQLQSNIGQNQAGGYAGTGGFLGGSNASGIINNLGGLVKSGYNYLGGLFGGGDTSGGGGVSDMSGFNTPGDMGTASSGGWDSGGSSDPGNYWDTGGP